MEAARHVLMVRRVSYFTALNYAFFSSELAADYELPYL